MNAKYNAIARLQLATAHSINVTPDMMEYSRDMKDIGYVIMRCEDFLKLTTKAYGAYSIDWFMEEVKPASEYGIRNKHTPSIGILMKDGKVVEHEGRHRAASLIKDGIETMPVSIRVFESNDSGNAWPKYHWWKYTDNGKESGYLGVESIPHKWKAQWDTGFVFNASTVLKTFHWYYKGWGNP